MNFPMFSVMFKSFLAWSCNTYFYSTNFQFAICWLIFSEVSFMTGFLVLAFWPMFFVFSAMFFVFSAMFFLLFSAMFFIFWAVFFIFWAMLLVFWTMFLVFWTMLLVFVTLLLDKWAFTFFFRAIFLFLMAWTFISRSSRWWILKFRWNC